MLMNRRVLGRLGVAAVLGAVVGCAPEADKEPLNPSPGMKTAVIKAEGMH